MTPPALRNFRMLYVGEVEITAWTEATAIAAVASKLPEDARVFIGSSHPVLTLQPPEDDE